MKNKDADYACICANCEKSVPIRDENNVLCSVHGIVSKAYTCRKFEYDPLKRIPPVTLNAPELEYIDINKDE